MSSSSFFRHIYYPGLVVVFLLAVPRWMTIPPMETQSADDTRVTAAPGSETAEATKVIDQAKAALESGRTVSEVLSDRAYQGVRAWPRFRELIKQHASTGTITLTCADEPGEALHVEGTVRNARGEAVKDALMYMYHTSSKGWYSEKAAHISGNGGDSQHARLFGYLKTDGQGKYSYRTIRPAGYPQTDLPAHIHVMVEKQGQQELWTEIQFDDDPKLTAKWRKESQQAGFVICMVIKDEKGVQKVVADFRMK